jgi:hypothetical protein
MKTYPLILLLLIGCRLSRAQTLPVLDQNPASLRWYQLNTPHFRVLYPIGFDSTAERTAGRLEQLYEPVSASLGKRPRRISVLLQNQSTSSNGFVTLYPRRSEFFAVPPQDPTLLGTLDWLDLLAVHEFRHVVQYDKALQHYGRVLYTLFGNTGLYVPLLTVPDWFAEGDAVGTETLLSTSGRGRIPGFDLGMRANRLTGLDFDYQKAVCGSFRDNVPNHYVLGYFMTTYLKRTYGPDVWSQVLNRNYRRFPWPFAFSRSIRDVTSSPTQPGLSVEALYRQSMTDATDTWKKQRAGLSLTPAAGLPVSVEKAGTAHPVFTNYQHPQFLDDSTLICVKSGLGDIPRLVLLRKNKPEQTLHVQGFPNDPGMLSATATLVSWIEFGFDPRWGQRVYSTIRLLNTKTGKLTRLTHRTRYTAVALSPDNSRLIVVDNTTSYQTRLVVLDRKTGRVLKTLTNPDGAFYQHPRWQADNRTVIVVWLKNGQKTIQRIDTQTGVITDLLPRSSDNISHPQAVGPYVLYNSPRSGIDNIYAVDTRSGQVFQVTSRPLAAYHAAVSPSGQTVAFDDFGATGSRVVTTPFTPDVWTPVTALPANRGATPPVRFFGKLPQQDPGAAAGRAVLRDSIPSVLYPPRRFSRLGHAFNPYSWGGVLGSTGQNLTVGINSQDLLSTTQFSVGYAYNQAEQVGNFFANLSYQGAYPIFDLSFQRGNRNTSIFVDRSAPYDSLRSDRWQYNQLSAGVRLPLRLTNSKYIRSMSLSTYYNYQQVTGYDLPARYTTEIGFAGSLSALTYGISYSQLLRQSKRDVAPRWGQALSAVYRNTPFGGRLMASQLAVLGTLYVPGLGKHHSIRLRGGYQRQGLGDTYQFSPAVLYPRGQAYITAPQLFTSSVDYRLPLADTHWSVGRLAYVQRLKAGLFYDTALSDAYSIQTVGVDLSVVFNVLRIRTPLEAGVRTTYNTNTGAVLLSPLVIDIGF